MAQVPPPCHSRMTEDLPHPYAFSPVAGRSAAQALANPETSLTGPQVADRVLSQKTKGSVAQGAVQEQSGGRDHSRFRLSQKTRAQRGRPSL